MIPKVNKHQKLYNFLWNWNDKSTSRIKLLVAHFFIITLKICYIKPDGTTGKIATTTIPF